MKLGFKDEPNFSFRDMFRAILYLLGDLKKKYILFTLVLFAAFFYDLVPTLIIAKVIDFFTSYYQGESLHTFYFYVIILSVCTSAAAVIRLFSKGSLTTIQNKLSYIIKVRGFERLLDFSLRWHDAENTGNKIEKINKGINALNDTQKNLSNNFLPNSAAIIGVLVSFLFLQPWFLAYLVIYIGIFITVQTLFYRQMVSLNYEYSRQSESASGTYYEGLSNVLSIKTLGVMQDFRANVVSKEQLARDLQIQITKLNYQKWISFRVLEGFVLGGIILFTGYGIIHGSIKIGLVFIIFNYFQKLANGLADFTGIIDSMVRAKVGIARMMPIFWDDEGIKQGTQIFPKQWENITLQNAVFNYQNNEQQELDSGLKNLTLKINKFEKVGVVGKSGSGKSTFAKLLLGLYQFKSGGFKIGKVDFYDIKHENVTNEVALVLQDSEMFNLSLKENITLMRTFDEALFKRATDIAQLDELIKVLPNGIETLIGEKGYRLSGGERQRIGIARAIYKDPQILVLDEATSSLDSQTESRIQEAFEKNLSQKTVISIAHRVSTLKNVDRILVFEDGQIVEQGTFKDLSTNPNSKFFEISKFQSKENSTV